MKKNAPPRDLPLKRSPPPPPPPTDALRVRALEDEFLRLRDRARAIAAELHALGVVHLEAWGPPRPPSPSSMQARLRAVVDGAARAMTTKEILRAAKVPARRSTSALATLAKIANAGFVQRIRKGIYAPLTVADTALPPPTLTEKLRAVLDQSGRTMTTAEILAAAKLPRRQRGIANGLLTRMEKKGLLRRVQTGVYASIAATDLTPRAAPTLSAQLLDAIEQSGRAMTTAEILNAANIPPARRLSATSILSSLVNRGAVRRVRAGLFEPHTTSLGQSLLAVLGKHPEGLDVQTLAARLQVDEEELDEALRALLRDERVRRVRRGVYVARPNARA